MNTLKSHFQATAIVGLNPRQLEQAILAEVRAEIDSLISRGITKEEAAKIVAKALADMSWNLANSKSPHSG